LLKICCETASIEILPLTAILDGSSLDVHPISVGFDWKNITFVLCDPERTGYYNLLDPS